MLTQIGMALKESYLVLPILPSHDATPVPSNTPCTIQLDVSCLSHNGHRRITMMDYWQSVHSMQAWCSLSLPSNLINNLLWYLQPIQLERSLYAVQQSCNRKQWCLYRRHTRFKCHQIKNPKRIQPPSYPCPKKIRLNEWESPACLLMKLDVVENAGLVNQFVHNHNTSDIMRYHNVFCDNDGSHKNIEDISSQKIVKAKQSHTIVQDEMEIVPTQTSWVPRLWDYLTPADNRLFVSRIKLPQCFIGEMTSNTV